MPNHLSLPTPHKIFLIFLFTQASCSLHPAVDYNGTPLNKAGTITLTPTTPTTTLNNYFATSNSAGLPNNSFGSLGSVTTNISPQTGAGVTSSTTSLLLQPDGKIIAVTAADMIRYNTNGTLDSSFGTGGIATAGTPGAAALLNSGQIALAANNLIKIYTSNGTFSSTLPGTGVNAIYGTITVQSSNGDIIAGGLDTINTFDYFVARWTPALLLDTTNFAYPHGYVEGPGTGGVNITSLITDNAGNIYAVGTDLQHSPCLYSSTGVETTFTSFNNTYQTAVMLDGNGNVVAASNSALQFASWAAPTPSTAPLVPSTSVPGTSKALLLQPTANNAIIIIGNDGANNLKVVRFIGVGTPGASTYGNVDTTFANEGILTGIPMTAAAGAVQPDGKILVGGNFNSGPFINQVCVIRLNQNGTIDPTFQTPNFLGNSGSALTATLQTNGTVVVSGTDGIQTCFASYLSNGSLNPAFGSGVFKSVSGIVNASVVQTNGSLVTAGCCGQFLLARYTPTGALDTTFGSGNGFVTGPVGAFSPYALLLQPNGSLVALGTTALIGGNFCLVRYTSTGIVDNSFSGGLVTGPNGTARAGILQSTGQIIAAGQIGAGNTYLTRYNSDGSPDGTFNNGTGSFTGVAGTLYAAIAQPNGSLIFAGTTGANFLLLRTTANGVPDPTFGINGFATGPTGTAYAILLQPDGSILALGQDGTEHLCLTRFTPTGALDTTFGSGNTGVKTGEPGAFYAGLLLPNNQILGIGNTGTNFFISNYLNPFTLSSFTASYGSVGMV